ncbi:hypothetical protein Zmor_007467 [Zophobas morio]|uniref:Ionotropic glutamate receptor C-terminal domain-containing protein n=1 Tax=Zophobas morio TaxID=2755281 RepID=A0AA38IZB4_9CUCU|nr:hypothetical protein Zmor_007467 [Zophobas morio]
MMNATFKIIEPEGLHPFDGAYNDIMNNVTDFCFISQYYMSYLYQDADYTYTHRRNQLVIVIPSKKGTLVNSGTFVSIFHPTVWILFMCSIIVSSIVTFILTFFEKKVVRINCLQYFSTFLGNPSANLNTQPFILKTQSIVLIFSCIIFRTAFQCFLVSSFVLPKPHDEIKTISEFRNSRFNIYTTPFLANMIPPEENLSDRTINISFADRTRMLYSLDTRGAYLVTRIFAKKFIETLKNKYAKPPFYIMEEALAPSIETYYFQRHSPYLEKVNECLLRQKQYALSEIKIHSGSSLRGNITNSESTQIVLGVKHLQNVFHILAIGLLLGVVVFICEILLKNKNK